MKIKDHTHFSDQEFEQLFETYQLKPGMFSHEAHLRLAYLHIKKYGVAQAEINMCKQIEGFALSLGATDKFNKTVTIASVKVMNQFMKESTSDNFFDFIKEFPKLNTHFKDVLGTYYGFNVFADKRAKKEFLAPDLLPFT
ncbi:MAG: hypothetical protein AB8B73_01510 [Ekhidna sp.]